jgi:hypothetical protein
LARFSGSDWSSWWALGVPIRRRIQKTLDLIDSLASVGVANVSEIIGLTATAANVFGGAVIVQKNWDPTALAMPSKKVWIINPNSTDIRRCEWLRGPSRGI